MAKDKKSKRIKRWSDIQKSLKNHTFFDPDIWNEIKVDDWLNHFTSAFWKKPSCDWCILDVIATSDNPKLIDFFVEVARSPLEKGYPTQVATLWLKVNAPSDIHTYVVEAHEDKLRSSDSSEREDAVFVMKYLGNEAHHSQIWYARETVTFEDYEETQAFRQMVFDVMKEDNPLMTWHIGYRPMTE